MNLAMEDMESKKRGRKAGTKLSNEAKQAIGQKIRESWEAKHEKMKKYIKISYKNNDELAKIKQVLENADIKYDLMYIKGTVSNTKRGRQAGTKLSDDVKQKIGERIRQAWANKKKPAEQCHCLKCKEKVVMANVEQKTDAKGYPIMTGNCPNCNRKLVKFLKRT